MAYANNKASNFLDSFESPGYTSKPAPSGGGSNQQAPSGSGMETWRYGSPSDIRKAKFGSGGGSRGGGYSYIAPKPIAQTTTRTERKGEAPDMPDLPTFVAPEMDKRKTRALQQKLAAPGIRTLRQTMQQAAGKNYENPNVRKLTLRDALQGYGSGLEKVMSGAGREARSEQMAELDLQRQEQMVNFQQQTNAAMQSYQNAWQDYLKGEETVTTRNPDAAYDENEQKFQTFRRQNKSSLFGGF